MSKYYLAIPAVLFVSGCVLLIVVGDKKNRKSAKLGLLGCGLVYAAFASLFVVGK
jgi:hypothetical protein